MPEPMVVSIMRAHKKAILAQEESKIEEMARRWLIIERSMADDLSALALEAARLQEEGQIVNKALVLRMERMKKLLYQVRAETGKYVNWADEFISDYQALLAEQGIEHANDAIISLLDEYEVSGSFDRLNVSAIENMIGMAGDGSPLERYLRDVHMASADGMIDALINGVAKGMHPTKIATEMANGLGIGLQKAMNTARTETLRAYRNAMLMQYDASGLVVGYKRISARDECVCAGCLFTDGQIYEDLSQFEEHNQGRCSAVPILKNLPEPQWQDPKEWFEGQTARVQESILGTGRFDAWKNGASLDSMVKRVENPTWGGAFVPTPVSEL